MLSSILKYKKMKYYLKVKLILYVFYLYNINFDIILTKNYKLGTTYEKLWIKHLG